VGFFNVNEAVSAVSRVQKAFSEYSYAVCGWHTFAMPSKSNWALRTISLALAAISSMQSLPNAFQSSQAFEGFLNL
jgi:hypothetical protein